MFIEDFGTNQKAGFEIAVLTRVGKPMEICIGEKKESSDPVSAIVTLPEIGRGKLLESQS